MAVVASKVATRHPDDDIVYFKLKVIVDVHVSEYFDRRFLRKII
jgi:hypothetical protein